MELNQLHYPFAEQASQINGFVLKEKKSIYCWTRSRPTRTFGESNDQVRDKSESKYQRVQDKSETIEKRLESGLSPTSWLQYSQLKNWNNVIYMHVCNLPLVLSSTSNSGSISSSYSIEWRLSDQFIVYFCHLLDWSVK